MRQSQWSISKLYSLQLYQLSIVYGLYVLRAGHNDCISSVRHECIKMNSKFMLRNSRLASLF